MAEDYKRKLPVKMCPCGRKFLETRGNDICLFCLKEDPEEYERTYPFKIVPTVLLPNPQTEHQILHIKNVVEASLEGQ